MDNDIFFANYLAPTAGFRAYNIGGDKNLIDAQKHWPAEMLASGGATLDAKKISAGVKMLTDGTADVLVLPYFDMLWAAQPGLEVVDSSLFATVRLAQSSSRQQPS